MNKKSEYFLTRFIFLRLLGFVYLFAFLSLALQVIPLVGENGILPAKNFIEAYGHKFESKYDAFLKFPTLFWFNVSDILLVMLAWLGVILAFFLLIGFGNSITLFIMWFLYLSYVHIGQLWYGYGWEIQLLETGFLAIFICPLFDFKPFPKSPPPKFIIYLLRWLTFRIHLGSGLIKLRGDSCWQNLTCLFYHYETQPIPNPLSPWFHFLPKIIHKIGVFFSHFIQLVVPFFIFWPRIVRNIAGLLLISFQLILILSGNLSFLNWITIVPIIACFDDRFLSRVLPKWIINKSEKSKQSSKPNKVHNIICFLLLLIVALLSIPVIKNLLSDNQYMNTSFNRIEFVNTYGAFGSIGKTRYELIIEGTDELLLMENTTWKEYEFKAKPGRVDRELPIIAPYQPRIDWQIWFAAMSRPEREPWLIHFVWMLLNNDENALSLISYNPFLSEPPKYIKIEFYQYEFLPVMEENVWRRTKIGTWLNPISKETKGLMEYVQANGWKLG